MKEHFVTEEAITAFVQYLRQEEREAATIEKYSRQVRTFYRWLKGRAVTKETGMERGSAKGGVCTGYGER